MRCRPFLREERQPDLQEKSLRRSVRRKEDNEAVLSDGDE
jgi:hypothetical protein